MSGSTAPTGPNIFPALRYADAPAAIAWLGRAFGFNKQMEVPGPDGTIAHAQLTLGPGRIMLGSVRHEPSDPWAGQRTGIYIYVENVDAHYAQAKGAGARIVRELQDTPYGSREYSATDPEGFLWSFGNYRP